MNIKLKTAQTTLNRMYKTNKYIYIAKKDKWIYAVSVLQVIVMQSYLTVLEIHILFYFVLYV